MAMQTCHACGKQVRATTLGFILKDGRMSGARVCTECVRDGVLIVAPKLAPVVDASRAERRSEQEVLAPFIRLLKGQAKALSASLPIGLGPFDDEVEQFKKGKIEGLETAIAALKGGRA